MIKSKNLLYGLTLLLITAGISPSCHKDNTFEGHYDPIVLGVVLPLDQEKGQLRENALRLAIQEINTAGGIGPGHSIELQLASSAGANRKQAAAEAVHQMLDVVPEIVGLVSCFSSSSLGIVEAVSIPQKYPTISGAATSTSLSGISNYFHRLCPPDGFEAKVLAARAALYGITSVAIAAEAGDAYCFDLATSFQNEFEGGAETIIEFEASDADYDSKMNQLLANQPEAVFVSMLNPAAYTAFFNYLSEHYSGGELDNTSFILCDALYSDALFQLPIGYMIGEVGGHPKNFGAFPAADTASEAYRYFQEKLMSKYQQQVASYNAQFYDIGYIYALALERTLLDMKLSNSEAFRTLLNTNIRLISNGGTGHEEVHPDQGWQSMKAACMNGEVNYTGASGPCDIDASGDTETAFALFKIVQSGESYSFTIVEVIP